MNEVGLPSGYRLHHLPVVGSTNDEAKALARAGAAPGTVIWADVQSAGRGRRGREWQSPAGNLYMSLIQRPAGPPATAAQLGFVTALALSDALAVLPNREGGVTAISLKWPNDVLVNGRKIAGILLESETGIGGDVDFVVIGTGVNIATAPEGVEYPATSLAAEGIRDIAPAALLNNFIAAFDHRARQWRTTGFPAIRAAWLARANGIGESIRVRLERSTLDGRFLDLDDDGALVLQSAEGVRRITAGAVFPAA
jgi:BirA family biotin operon repressor/biotin-[acetyl-CoA-carboxylase] ligase